MYSFIPDGTAEERQIAFVRNETEDVTDIPQPVAGTDYFLSDRRIKVFLATAREEAPSDANDAEVRLFAAAAALDVLATNQAFVLKKGKTLADETDGPAVGAEIRKHAARCIARAWTSINDRRKIGEDTAGAAKKPRKPPSGGVPMRSVY